MPSPRRGRSYWSPLIAKFESAPCAHEVFAAEHGLNLGTFRTWLYKLRREGGVEATEVAAFVEISATHEDATAACRVRLGDVSIEFAKLPTAEYLVAIAALSKP